MPDRKSTKAFELLAHENARMLKAYLHSLLRDKSAVDDLFQETLLVAWRKLDEVDRTRPFGPWLRAVAYRLVLAHSRREQRFPVCSDEGVQSILEQRFDAIDSQLRDTWGEKIEALNDCLNALSSTHRDAIDGRYFRDLRTNALAEHLGISFEACKKRLTRARRLLAECLSRKGMTVSAEVSQ